MKNILQKNPIVIILCCITAAFFLSGCSMDVIEYGQQAQQIISDTDADISTADEIDGSETVETDNNEFVKDTGDNENNESGIDPELDAIVRKRLDIQLITPNEYSRPGDALTEVNNIVVHYLANPGTTAQENRDYFDSLAYSGEEYASTHFIIGLEGEIIQLIPLDEISYCSNDRNYDTVAIECCHPDESGVYTEETYDSLVLLTAWLCEMFDLDYSDIIRHYDVTGKICPLAFVTSPDYYYSFKADVANTMGDSITADQVAVLSNDEFLNPEEAKQYEEDRQYEEDWHPDPPDRHEDPRGVRPPE